MSVELVSVTPDAEKTILYVARVSSDQSNESVGLLRYLIRNKHWSPFEHASMTLEFVTSRGIAAQILRHRSFVFQEFSQRYATPDHWVTYAGRRPSDKDRQSSIDGDSLDKDTQDWWQDKQVAVARIAFEAYAEAVERGVAKECARFILPLSTETKLYMTGSLRSWIHYFDLRCDEHTQFEHRELASQAKAIFAQQFPVIAEALGWEEDKS